MRNEVWQLMNDVCSADRSPEMREAIAAELEADREALFAECEARRLERFAERKAGRLAGEGGNKRIKSMTYANSELIV